MARFLHAHVLAATGAATVAALVAAPAAAAPSGALITSGPANNSFVSSTSASYAFSEKGAPKATFTCQLDTTGPVACTSPHNYTGLAQGQHTFTVKANDGTTDSRTWTVDTVAPKPAITAPTTLTAPAAVAFGEKVAAVKNATVASLTLTDGGATVPATTTCWNATKSVACASANFDAVQLKPNAALTPGQHYTVTVGAGVVQDLAGNKNTAASKAFRAAQSLQETAPGIATTWQKITNSSAAGGSFVREHLTGASATWRFTGTSVTLRTVTGPTYGKADLYIDGVRKKTINTYATSRHFNVGRSITGLTNTAHKLKVVVLGVKGAKAGKGTYVAIDGFTVGSTKTDTPTLSTTWRRLANNSLSGGHAIVTDLGNSTLTFTCRGTGVALYTVKGVNQGKVAVYVDGVKKATFDDYATSTSYGVKRLVSGLTDAVHTVKVVVLGTHHKGAKGSLVTVDRFLVS